MSAVDWFVADRWLTETMSRPVFRCAVPADAPASASLDIVEAMKGLSGSADAFFFCRLPTTSVTQAQILTRAGFSVVDTAITFQWTGELGDVEVPGIDVGLIQPHQAEAVADVAERSFRWSRFHLDPNIPKALANFVKRQWIENYCTGRRGSALYVAEVDRIAVGFLAVIESVHDGNKAATIDLIGVTPEYQGRRAGTALVCRFLSDWRSRASLLRVGTQAANIQSMRFYERLGFRAVESSFVLHAHYQNRVLSGTA